MPRPASTAASDQPLGNLCAALALGKWRTSLSGSNMAVAAPRAVRAAFDLGSGGIKVVVAEVAATAPGRVRVRVARVRSHQDACFDSNMATHIVHPVHMNLSCRSWSLRSIVLPHNYTFAVFTST